MNDETAGPGLLYGRNPVREALEARQSLNKILIADTASRHDIADILTLARAQGVVYQFVDRRQLDQLVQGVHQGVVAMAAERGYADLSALLEVAVRRGEPPLLVLLDEIQDPHNLGSIIRSADALQAHGVVIPRRHAAGLTPAVAKASAGTVAHLPVARVGNLNQAMEELKKAGLWLIGLETDAKTGFDKVDYTGPIGLVIGSEGKGLRSLVRQHCDTVVRLPIGGHAGSLNASVAAAILLYEVYRQRMRLQKD
ncbi:MAG: 23S rRNA (guanosine(2251)-2'-O)-methyltransferase RlmB [candidate division Zixibacteria bacterium]|nr:23S rRNA (guanosine(2251)-2'-O)-methyltransferase RlmB [candidate division Zixibacteria bacterium]